MLHNPKIWIVLLIIGIFFILGIFFIFCADLIYRVYGYQSAILTTIAIFCLSLGLFGIAVYYCGKYPDPPKKPRNTGLWPKPEKEE